MSVRKELIRIANENPNLRSVIVPALKKNDTNELLRLAKNLLAEEEEVPTSAPAPVEPEAKTASQAKRAKAEVDANLRKQLIRLASERPDLRDVLIPLLKAK
jgi:aspartokinase